MTNCHPLRNTASEGSDTKPFDPAGPQLDFLLAGDAARTDDASGKYGRAVAFDPTVGAVDFIEVTGIYTGFDTPDLYSWWQLDSTTAGVFWLEECRFEVGLDTQSKVYVKVYDDDCTEANAVTYTSTQTWPGDGGWHHLIVHRFQSITEQKFGISIDFGTQEVLTTVDLPASQPAPSMVRFGEGIQGRVDELQAADYAPGPEAYFDYDEVYCPESFPQDTVCEESVATAAASALDQFAWDVPARYKLIYDSADCTQQEKCRVVFLLAGGGACGDNYARATDGIMQEIFDLPEERSPLAMVTVDPICFASDYKGYPDEITQILAVKADLANHLVLDWSGDEYYATGCSHGAKKVLQWAVQNLATPLGDRPKRVFARSAGGTTGAHVDCEYHEVWCGEKQELWDQFHFEFSTEICNPVIEGIWPHDHTDPNHECAREYIAEQDPFIDNITQPVVQDYEVGRSWGVNITDTVCSIPSASNPDEPTKVLCPEEGGLGATDGGRQFRDAWIEAEQTHLAQGVRTGLFIENDTADCRHCGLTGLQMACVVAYLEGGRDGLHSDCEELEGDPAEDCAIYPLP